MQFLKIAVNFIKSKTLISKKERKKKGEGIFKCDDHTSYEVITK